MNFKRTEYNYPYNFHPERTWFIKNNVIYLSYKPMKHFKIQLSNRCLNIFIFNTVLGLFALYKFLSSELVIMIYIFSKYVVL